MSGSNPTEDRQRPPRRERRQRRALARQQAHGQSLNAWLQDQAIAATKARASLLEEVAAAARKAGKSIRELFGRRHPAAEPLPRGRRSPLTGVPGRHQDLAEPGSLVESSGANHAQRRAMSRVSTQRRPLNGLGPLPLGRPQSRAVRRRMKVRTTQPPGNEPYRSPARAAKLARAGRLRAELRDSQ